ncbi:dicarboxylate/amino acid:cation symporter [Parabacteroides sp. Marseille-P3160]|uniref:dicarboxylate/amino acid:cation symporter n=1 Tax=Parabacteroides sp. Marseille-P3160 TaxID=1917887 RepID=UPI0009BC3048|nr:dicarboxylate/amino acid:cation symporter [Parabacteroides sp. Marseille-P3160]
MNILKNYAFTFCLLAGIVIGGVCGIIFKEDASIVKPVGDLFLNLMFVLIVPLVLFSVSSAICNMKQSEKVGKVTGNIVLVFLVTSIIVAGLAYFLTLFYNPLDKIDRSEIISGLSAVQSVEVQHLSSAELLVNTFTVSDFPLLFTKTHLLPLILFSILLGLGVVSAGKKGKIVACFLNSATQVVLKMITIIMYAAPVGLGCYFADTIGQLGGQLLHGYANAFVLYLVLAFISFFGLNSLYLFLAGGKKAFVAFWSNILTPALTAIATSSSAACIPVNIAATHKMGVPLGIAETVIPLGTNLHKDGSIIGGVLKIAFLFTIFGREMTGVDSFLMIIGVALLVGIVIGAIPSGGMTGELLICSVFGFSPQMVGTLMVITTIIDVPATLLNSTGNIMTSVLVTRLTEGKRWIEKIVN